CLPAVGDAPLDPARSRRQGAGAEPAAQGAVAVYPPLRGRLDRPERPVLRPAADGRRVPGHVRARARPPQGDGRPLDAPRADVGRRAGLQDAWLLAVAQHGEILWIDLAPGNPPGLI